MDGSLAVAVNQDEVESFLHIPYSVFAFSLFGLLLKNTLDLHIPYLILWYLYERAKEGSLSLRSLEYRLAVSDERKNMKKKGNFRKRERNITKIFGVGSRWQFGRIDYDSSTRLWMLWWRG